MSLACQSVLAGNPIWIAIQKIDLEPISVKIMYSEDGESMNRDEVHMLADLYQRYLFLAVSNPGEAIVPTKGIDKFWHMHILDTAKYRVDCQEAFGFFLDHFPYFGLRGKDDRQVWEESLQKTAMLYESVFGDKYLHNELGSLCGGGDDCGSACAKCCEQIKNPMNTWVRPTFEMIGVSVN